VKRICVFCGSSVGARPAYREAAVQLAEALVARDLGLVYGGAGVGLMGTLADAVLARGGSVVGVIPRSLVRREIAHQGLDDLREVETMHERKALMAELSDGFVALPGAYGTLDELAEALTWSQLGLHTDPIGLLDVDGYFEPLLRFFDGAVEERFLDPRHRELLLVDRRPGPLLDRLRARGPVTVDKWADRPAGSSPSRDS
jgi:uncharacterized protein (TIGR00730 family)